MDEHKIKLSIGPMTLELVTRDNPQYVEALAAALDAQLLKIMNNDPRLSLSQAMAFLTLQAYDDTKKANDETATLRQTLKSYLEDVNTYRSAADKATEECERLKRQLRDLS